MGDRFKSLINTIIGVVAGLFIGGTLGELLGAGLGAIGSLVELREVGSVQLLLTGALKGLGFGAIIGGGLLSLARAVFSTGENLLPKVLLCSFIGMTAGMLYSTILRKPISSADFMFFAGSVGLWAGMATGGFVGVLTGAHASRNRMIVSEEEKKRNTDYASFLKEKASHK